MSRWGLHEMSVQPDHVHLLLQISPSETVSGVVGLLKGGTSRVIRAEFPDLEEYLWGDSFWSDGFFAETVGQKEESAVRAYLQNQGVPRSAPRPKPRPRRARL